MNRSAILLITIFVFLAVSVNAARNPMDYWYDWKEIIENDPAVAEIGLGWEDNTYWRVDVALDAEAIEEKRLLMLNTGITREMCEEAAFPMVLVITYNSERSWRGLYKAKGSGFFADALAQSINANIVPVFSEETNTYLVWLP